MVRGCVSEREAPRVRSGRRSGVQGLLIARGYNARAFEKINRTALEKSASGKKWLEWRRLTGFSRSECRALWTRPPLIDGSERFTGGRGRVID
jgi:hypothetical protein